MNFEKTQQRVKEANKKEEISSGERYNGFFLEKKIGEFISNLRKKYPHLEKIIKTPNMTFKILTAFVMMQGGQLVAQEVVSKDNYKNPFSASEINVLNTMTFSEIEHKLEPLKKTLPIGKKVTFSNVFKEDDRLKNTDYNGIFTEGVVPSDTGMVGDAAIVNNSLHIMRSDYELNSKKGEEFNSQIHNRLMISELKFSKFETGEIKETGSNITVEGGGSTKEAAISEAMYLLSMCYGRYLCSGSCNDSESKKFINNSEEYKNIFTDYISINGISFFKNIHIDKIEARKPIIKVDEHGKEIGKSDEIVYYAQISAQKGIYKEGVKE